MRHLLAFALVLVVSVLSDGGASPVAPRAALASSHGVEVTSALDGAGECPHESLCTLRAAIEAANDDAEPGAFTITFDPEVFPPDAPATISVSTAPLPNVSRNEVAIDATGAGVAITGDFGGISTALNGLTVTGSGLQLRGLRIHGFTGSCLAVTGADATIGGPGAGQGNVFGGCPTAIGVAGPGATIQGNLVGFTPGGAADPVASGIVVSAGGALVGGPALTPEAANRIGFADAAIFVGAGAGEPFSGVAIERNHIGSRPGGEAAPVGTAVIIDRFSSGTTVIGNTIENAGTGIALPAGGEPASIGNQLLDNSFASIGGLAIDLGGDGIRNPNDEGDIDAGPNNMVNHPVITRATQLRLTGTACAGCAVRVYIAEHQPGGATDYGRTPLPGATAVADASGEFAIESPAAAPGDWLVALVTDTQSNTSEFGPPARVGTGAVLCGNVQLQAGWNHVAFFGFEPVALLNTFPADPAGAVTAIYRFVDGSDEWERWFAQTAAGRTLHSVQPGESYWMYAAAPVTLPGGFSISFPVPVSLTAGWNDFVYLGGSAHPLDALASLDSWSDLYRYDSAAGRWLRFGDASIPAWAQEFSTLEACTVYQLRLAEPATLLPLQP